MHPVCRKDEEAERRSRIHIRVFHGILSGRSMSSKQRRSMKRSNSKAWSRTATPYVILNLISLGTTRCRSATPED
ncbi:hypothetical protein T05_426 [Trichinella murrelli]|uniref:Uncharacterized protein n=1 Tax=Trichinella murrelli TaxID=144512 RepID=A0A0V0UFZ1_9BILA|nr:hypothetical protein T05_426 [Trichinella murrelli]